MSRILLISSNTTTEPLPVYPLGMALIASSLVQNGHDVKQLDLLFNLENILSSVTCSISEFNPDFIGISIRNIDTVDSLSPKNTWYLADIKDLVEHIQKISQKPIILGGPAFSIMPDQILKFLNADFGIVGEGEISFNKLIDTISNNVKTKKIVYPTKTPITQNGFFSPLYEKELVAYYFDQSGMLSYQTKRGCPHGCNYCSYPLIEGNKLRNQTPEFVVDNLIRLKKCAVFVFSGIRILPKTGLSEIAVKEGIISSNNNLLKPCYYVSPLVDKNWMDKKIKDAFHKKKDRFSPPEEGQMRMRALKMFGFRGLLWDIAIIPKNRKNRAL